ncbi:type VII secretion AAA-ATPase EccA [Gordonia rubripertincta]|uniref:Type VII secretion AAA-ATPase EccA n=1 Tax=Gordonia rubripertincta TaxID=36822 RepID=A0ABT4N1V7_GORRU|nr:type VII secretion AAA-ATPase EccA [Gordonia rubripertincta]MCZ4553236.1 type VII secretion AAA-ATPase EccA [Gordonia rubripertincta]
MNDGRSALASRTGKARQLFDFAVLSSGIPVDGQQYPPDRDKATLAFTRATEWDPALADAWLGRLVCGDNSAAVFLQLYRSRAALGAEQRRLGLPPRTLSGRFSTGLYIDYPLADRTEAIAAYAATLIAGADHQGAEDALDEAAATISGRAPIVDYLRASVHFKTQRWPDVLTALGDSERWTDDYMSAGADLMAGSACVQMGLFGEGIRRLEAARSGPIPAAATAAMFTHGLALREMGSEEAAREQFEAVYSRDPSFAPNTQALADQRFRLVVTTAETIASRTDKWDPATAAVGPAATEEAGDGLLLSAAQAELDEQIGLESVKSQVSKLKSAATLAKLRAEKGLATGPRSLHLAFTGPPGTGKTTIARIVAKIYCGLGLIKTDNLVQVSRRDLVGEHLGSTAIKTSAVIDRAMDGVLFIDEAYTLIQSGLSGGDAFGREAIDTLLARMEDNRDRLVVIIAGYDAEIDRLLTANEGMSSRFSKRIRFDSYTPSELARIAELLARKRDSLLSPEALSELEFACGPLYHQIQVDAGGHQRRAIDAAGNGRFVRNIVESAEEEREHRLTSGVVDLAALDDDALMRIEVADIQAALASVLSGLQPSQPLDLNPRG